MQLQGKRPAESLFAGQAEQIGEVREVLKIVSWFPDGRELAATRGSQVD